MADQDTKIVRERDDEKRESRTLLTALGVVVAVVAVLAIVGFLFLTPPPERSEEHTSELQSPA